MVFVDHFMMLQQVWILAKTYYEKVFVKNNSIASTSDLTDAKVIEVNRVV